MKHETLKTGFGPLAKVGISFVIGLFIVMFIWAYTTNIKGAVAAFGNVEIIGKPKLVQHLDGGIVEAIFVDEGATIEKGQAIIRLDDTMLRANLAIYKSRLYDNLAIRDRLTAELGDWDAIVFKPLPNELKGYDTTTAQAAQVNIFKARKALNKGRKLRIKEKISQFEHQMEGLVGLKDSYSQQEVLINTELNSLVSLNKNKLIADNDLLASKRSLADIQGQYYESLSEIARIRNMVNDAELELIQVDREFQEEVVNYLKETKSRIYELTQQLVSTQSQLDRVNVVASISGRIHDLRAVTEGGVIKAGEVIAQIVSTSSDVYFDTKVSPVFIDQVHPKQIAKLRFSAFDQNTTPQIEGFVSEVSPTTKTDEATGQPYYTVTILADERELNKLGKSNLIPGMPIEAYLQTTDRTVLSYLVKPISDKIQRAFRER